MATKAKHPAPLTPPLAQDRARLDRITFLVNEIGRIEPEVATVLPKVRKLEDYRAELRKLHDQMPADQDIRAEGTGYFALLGPKTKKRLIDYPALWKRAGIAVMKKIATVTLSAIEEECGKDVVDAVTKEELAGARSVKVFAKEQAAA